MPAHFDLVITADHANATAELRLLDASGVQIAFRQTDFKQIPVGQQRGLFDLRNYLRLYVEAGKEAAAVADIGVCIADAVLGKEIFEPLWQSESQRTLRIQLPGAATEENVPGRGAGPRAVGDRPPERRLSRRWPSATSSSGWSTTCTSRLRHRSRWPPTKRCACCSCLPTPAARVRWARARSGAQLLGCSRRRSTRQRRVVAHFLSHGVTRERLEAQIRENGGYHIVHWSGHGHLNLLELAKPGGAKDQLSGQELLDLFTDAGGFFPRLFFLSACHSGDILRVRTGTTSSPSPRARSRATGAEAPGRRR